MKKSSRTFKTGCTILAGLVVIQSASGGWSGYINGLGVGWSGVNTRSITLNTNIVTTTNNSTYPSSASPPYSNYQTNIALPAGASTNTYARIKGLSGGVWSGATKAAVGDGSDNPELQKRVHITPADCASLYFESKIDQTQAEFNANGNSGSISVTAKATAGTALWLRGFEYTGPMSDVPMDDPATLDVNESIEFLKLHGTTKFETLVLGPFEFGGENSATCPLKVPFTLSSSNLEHLIFASDGAALSLPLVVVCPPDVVVKCDESFSYPAVEYAGCGDITLTYSIPRLATPFPPGYFAVGTTPVTVTATDGDGNSTSCTFNVVVTDSVAPVAPALPTLVGESSVTVPQPPNVTDNCGDTISATTTDPKTYNTQGTFTVHWNYDDKHGNVATANQTVIVDDVTAPVIPALPTVTGQCSAAVTAPVATDAVAGNITGTTSDPLTYNTQGTFTVHWSFNDGNGNTSTANQTVIVKDTIAPVAPALPRLTADCGSSLTLVPPQANDNCAGSVTGTTTSPLIYTAQGSNNVIWTFNDGNGNISTATQTVVVAGLTFHGFYSPINGTGGTCGSPLRTVTLGNNVPVKFDTTCGGLPYDLGLPSLSIERSSPNCDSLTPAGGGNFVLVGNEWHFNWDTSGLQKGTYKLTAILQDGGKQIVWIKVK